jgi:hypothetical protein
MKVKFKQSKGNRIRKQFNWFECEDSDIWWSEKLNKWVSKSKTEATKEDKKARGCISNYIEIKTLKSAIRHLKKQTYLPKGLKFYLTDDYCKHEIYITL